MTPLTPNMGVLHFPGSMLASLKSQLMGKAGVYALYSPSSGNYYIGSSVNLWNRLSDYSQPWFVAQYHNLPIGKAIIKYGYDNFVVVILEYTAADDTISTEQRYLDLYKPTYNVLKTAGATLGHKHTDASKEKMRQAKLGNKLSPAAVVNMSLAKIGVNKGEPKSEETKRKISLAMTGKPSPKAKTIQVLDLDTGITTTYNGYAKTAKALGLGIGAVRTNIGRNYNHYVFSIVPR